MSRAFGPRRAEWIEVDRPDEDIPGAEVRAHLTRFDLIYRSIVATQFNYHQSGHPGGSVSVGHILTALLFDALDYDLADPVRDDQDLVSFAAGHKATGLYGMWALRDEVVRVGRPDLLPTELRHRLRLEDLLGFRRNPTHDTPLFRQFHSKPLDGHPTPMTPFVRLATGPSGVGVGSSTGLAFAAADTYGRDAPRVHMIEGEGGLTPGRVYEAAASAGASGLSNLICHLDWNQASIDSDRVTREGDQPGEYVQWDPMEFFYIHDWNVVHVPDGFDMALVLTGQRRALSLDNGQPTVVVYRTEKGWKYGITGKKSHGGGHKMGADAWREAMTPLFGAEAQELRTPENPKDRVEVEECYWDTLVRIREKIEAEPEFCGSLAGCVADARDRLEARGRAPRTDAPDVERIFVAANTEETPEDLRLFVGDTTPLRKQLGAVLGYLNHASQGAILLGAADLLDSTAVSGGAKNFPSGFFHTRDNPGSRSLSLGGICEDGLSCILTGISGFGRHIGAGASYGAFISPLGHIPSRVHAISQQMRQEVEPGPYRTFILQCGHAGMKTGEDGPTHADPQALQLHIENYVQGTAVTLTPWEPQEIWPLMAAALRARPAVIVPFVTRPNEPVLDREGLGLAPASAAAGGVYTLRAAAGKRDVTVVLQGSGVTFAFVRDALPRLLEDGVDLEVIYVASPELFDRRSVAERAAVVDDERLREAMGITGFTRQTMYRWIRSDLGLEHTMHPFQKGHYLGSGAGEDVIREAGLDGEAQYRGIKDYLDARAASA
jgi:transketolase